MVREGGGGSPANSPDIDLRVSFKVGVARVHGLCYYNSFCSERLRSSCLVRRLRRLVACASNVVVVAVAVVFFFLFTRYTVFFSVIYIFLNAVLVVDSHLHIDLKRHTSAFFLYVYTVLVPVAGWSVAINEGGWV